MTCAGDISAPSREASRHAVARYAERVLGIARPETMNDRAFVSALPGDLVGLIRQAIELDSSLPLRVVAVTMPWWVDRAAVLAVGRFAGYVVSADGHVITVYSAVQTAKVEAHEMHWRNRAPARAQRRREKPGKPASGSRLGGRERRRRIEALARRELAREVAEW